jgi:hypothetical protein
LLWKIRDANFPVLATTSTGFNPRNAMGTSGILGQPSTVVLFGGGPVDSELRSGARFRAGYWFDDCQTWGIDAGGFFLAERSIGASFSSNGSQVLTRPFFNGATNSEFSEVTVQPGLSGSLNISAPSELWGLEVNLRHNLLCGCWYRLDGLLGFRYLNLDESLNIREDIDVPVSIGGAFAGSHITVQDGFHTRNQFTGAQVGTDLAMHHGNWVLDVRGTVGLGNTHQTVDINGNQMILGGVGGNRNFGGGLLALPSNIGHHTRDQFSVVPELGVTLGYQVTENVRVFAGYNILYWTDVVRPGDQIDRTLNPRLIPNFVKLNPASAPPGSANPVRPAFLFHNTDFWAQGMTVGAEFKY